MNDYNRNISLCLRSYLLVAFLPISLIPVLIPSTLQFRNHSLRGYSTGKLSTTTSVSPELALIRMEAGQRRARHGF